MKPFYPLFGRILTTAVLFISLNSSVKAQTTLVNGDIAFTGIHTGGAVDQFSFVLLTSITAGTVINFTDNGWLGTNAFRSGEQNIVFTSVALPAGREILISGTTATQAGNGASAGTVTGSALNLSTTADQIFAFQGTIASPDFISGIHMGVNVLTGLPCQPAELFENTDAANWDGSCANSSNNSWKPPALNGAGSTAFWIGVTGNSGSERDNARFNSCGSPLNTVAEVKAALANQANWITSDGVPAFNLPSNCAFLNLFPLPVNLLSFTGKLNSDKTVTLQWKVEGQQDAQEYIVEESTDGVLFRSLGIVTPTGSTVYSLIDAQVLTGSNYYRLKTVELSGRTTYSNIIVVNLKAGTVVSLYPNPVVDKLTIQQFGTVQNKTAMLTDAQGKLLQNIRLSGLQQTVDMERYTAGLYILKLDDGTIFKILKQ